MQQNILLTFKHIDGYIAYNWFETIDCARNFASNSKEIKLIIKCWDCLNAREVVL